MARPTRRRCRAPSRSSRKPWRSCICDKDTGTRRCASIRRCSPSDRGTRGCGRASPAWRRATRERAAWRRGSPYRPSCGESWQPARRRHHHARRGVRRGGPADPCGGGRERAAARGAGTRASAPARRVFVRPVLQPAARSGGRRPCVSRSRRRACRSGPRLRVEGPAPDGGRGRPRSVPGLAQGPQVLVHIAVLNGPNLNLLGEREPELYGRTTLAEIEARTRERARALGIDVSWTQTNHEGELVDAIQGLKGKADGLVINAAAYTHTSLAVRDALLAVRLPFVEVHLSNLFAREPERRRSMLADAAVGMVTGFGAESYRLGLEGLVGYLQARHGA